MISRWFNWLAIGLALLLWAPLHAAWQSAFNGSMLGKRMPMLSPALFSADGNRQAYGSIATSGVMLVDFWSPACLPCRDRVPRLNALQRDYQARGLTVIGMAREPPAEQAAFNARAPRAYPAGCDPGGALFAKMAIRSLPYAVLVDRNGIVVWQGDPSSLNRETIETTLDAPSLGALMRL